MSAFLLQLGASLFQAGFFVDDVFARHRIVFFEFELVRHGLFVLGRNAKVTGSG